MNGHTKRIGAAAVFAGALAMSGVAEAQTKLRVVSTPPGTGPFSYLAAVADMINKHADGVEAHVAGHGKATRHYVDATRGNVDIFFSQPLYHVWMTKGQRIFAKVKNGPEVANKASALFAINVAIFHFITREDSGIRELSDLKGKKVYLGPPGGGATFITTRTVQAATGLEAGKDFEVLKVGWNAGFQAFQDRQIDVVARGNLLPAAAIQQLVLTSKLRFLGIPKSKLEAPGVVNFLKMPGVTVAVIPKGIYGKNHTNETGVTTTSVWGQVGIRTDIDANVVYKITKAFWEHIDEVHRKSVGFKDLTLANAFRETASPIHPGAVKYYREIGVEVPERLLHK